jgi:hypothetical protein
MSKYILGLPNIIVQNMAGAGSMITADCVYKGANPNGLTIGAIFSRTVFRSGNRHRAARKTWREGGADDTQSRDRDDLPGGFALGPGAR